LILTVLYDADCDFCRHTAHVLRALDARRRLRFLPLQTASGPDVPRLGVLLERMHVRDERGSWFAGGDAMVRIAAEIPSLVPLAVAGRLPGAGALVEAVYRVVAAHRGSASRLLRLDRCRFEPDLSADD
jgi:predicted DCC family thiol-disulfide oxidoreductase YuxK